MSQRPVASMRKGKNLKREKDKGARSAVKVALKKATTTTQVVADEFETARARLHPRLAEYM